MVPEGDRLGHLQVGEAGHGGGGFPFGQGDDGGLELADQGDDVVDGVAQVEADVGGHLIVAGAAGVQALAGVADQGSEALFDVEMHVFQVERPFELAGFDLLPDPGHAPFDVGQVLGGDDALPGQHSGVGQGGADVLAPHALVEIHGGGVTLDQVGNGLGEAAGPGVLGSSHAVWVLAARMEG